MPRTYTRIKPQDPDLEENIKKAVHSVKDDGMSVRAAAKLYNVGRMTLQRRVTTRKASEECEGSTVSSKGGRNGASRVPQSESKVGLWQQH